MISEEIKALDIEQLITMLELTYRPEFMQAAQALRDQAQEIDKLRGELEEARREIERLWSEIDRLEGMPPENGPMWKARAEKAESELTETKEPKEGSGWDGEHCTKCGRDQRMAWAVKNECWNRIIPEDRRMNILCLECFFELADEQREHVKLDDFVYMAVATYKDLERPYFIKEKDPRPWW